jgi:type I restriction enzyme S subunit
MPKHKFFENIPAHWEETTLGDVCRHGGFIQTGPFGSQLHASDYVSVGIPSIMPQNIKDNRLFLEGIPRITAKDVERLSRYRVKPGDIVFSRRGDVDQHVLIVDEQDGWLCGTGCMQVRLGDDGVDPRYAYYYLSYPKIREWIIQRAIGATMPNLNISIVSAVPFLVPPLPEQRAIAHILGTLDDKIELNRKMNETLEAIARALFKSWFVDFDPVRAKMEGRQPAGMDAETAALFPDAFEDSELGEIPKGWKVGTLGEIADNPRRGVLPEDVASETPYIGLEHMPRKSIALTDWGKAGETISNKFHFRRGEILFGKLRPYFHKVGIATLDGVCSTDILVIVPKFDEWYSSVLCLVSSDEFVNHAVTFSDGTKMPRTNWQDMAKYETVIPTHEVAMNFNNRVLPMVQEIRANIMQSRTLAALRDALLPKLISGEVRVKDAGKFVVEML